MNTIEKITAEDMYKTCSVCSSMLVKSLGVMVSFFERIELLNGVKDENKGKVALLMLDTLKFVYENKIYEKGDFPAIAPIVLLNRLCRLHDDKFDKYTSEFIVNKLLENLPTFEKMKEEPEGTYEDVEAEFLAELAEKIYNEA